MISVKKYKLRTPGFPLNGVPAFYFFWSQNYGFLFSIVAVPPSELRGRTRIPKHITRLFTWRVKCAFIITGSGVMKLTVAKHYLFPIKDCKTHDQQNQIILIVNHIAFDIL